jgi:hypothetical protein
MGLYSDQAVGGDQFLPGAPVAGAEQLAIASEVAIPEFNISTVNTYWAGVHLPKGFYWLRFSSPNALSVSWHTAVNAWSPHPIRPLYLASPSWGPTIPVPPTTTSPTASPSAAAGPP